MIANITVITDNLDYLLLGRAAQGEPGGVLLSVLMTLGAGLLAFPGGIALACFAWRFKGWPLSAHCPRGSMRQPWQQVSAAYSCCAGCCSRRRCVTRSPPMWGC